MLKTLRESKGLCGLILLALLLGGCASDDPESTSETDGQTLKSASALHATTETELTDYFRTALGPPSARPEGTTPEVQVPEGVAFDQMLAASGTNTAVRTDLTMSGTVLQESGVDEADLIKSDGVSVYSLDPGPDATPRRNRLRRQGLNDTLVAPGLTPLASLELPFSTQVGGVGFYLDSAHQQLAVIGEASPGWGIYERWFYPRAWGQGLTEVVLVDTSEPAQLQTRHKLAMTGHLIGSRRIGATLYLILRSYPEVVGLDPYWPPNKTASNQELLDGLQAAQLLPKLTVDGGAAQPLVRASECYVQTENAAPSADIITVVALDLASPAPSHTARCFTGGTEAFYMSEQSLYLATTQTAYTYNDSMPLYQPTTSTDLHKFALEGNAVTYRGSGSVSGHLGFDQNRKSFRMGEYAGDLRVITQTEPAWGGWIMAPVVITTAPAATATIIAPPEPTPSASPGHLTILREKAGALQMLGELPNAARPQPLGKAGEQLYASRFLGNRGYLVTYRLTDPLYVLDLADPSDPKIAGELQVDGYSDYLFPLSQNLLLGVGKDASSDGSSGDGRFAWYQGVKVSLIDVSDPTAPREAARAVIGKRGTDATVLHDHHGIALQSQGNTVRISLPVSLHATPSPWHTGAANDYFDFTRLELERFEVDLTAQSLTARPPLVAADPAERTISNDRSLLWQDQVHWYQDGAWSSSAW